MDDDSDLAPERPLVMNLEEFAYVYFEQHEFGIKTNSQNCFYLPAARQFQLATKCDDVSKINRQLANQFVDWLKSRPISPMTQHTRRRGFVVLWKAAFDLGHCPVYEPCRKIRVPKRTPKAWSFAAVQSLMNATLLDQSEWAYGIPACDYWGSLFSAAWDTGLRLGDLLSIEKDWILRDPSTNTGTLRIVMSKCNREHLCCLNAQTMELIDRCIAAQPRRRLIWPLRSDRRQFYRDVKDRLQSQGFDGTFKYLRRSAVTHAESISPGLGTKLAGHRDSRVTRDSYIDPLLLPDSIVKLPPVS